jgi:hypothetical protein
MLFLCTNSAASKIVFLLLLTAFVVTPAYCQGKSENHQIETISGKVGNVDSVGNIITIQGDQEQMAFVVPDKVSITEETREIGLMDIAVSDPVTIQYYVSSHMKNTVVSIADNKPR